VQVPFEIAEKKYDTIYGISVGFAVIPLNMRRGKYFSPAIFLKNIRFVFIAALY
jgi:hypothetical protein